MLYEGLVDVDDKFDEVSLKNHISRQEERYNQHNHWVVHSIAQDDDDFEGKENLMKESDALIHDPPDDAECRLSFQAGVQKKRANNSNRSDGHKNNRMDEDWTKNTKITSKFTKNNFPLTSRLAGNFSPQMTENQVDRTQRHLHCTLEKAEEGDDQAALPEFRSKIRERHVY